MFKQMVGAMMLAAALAGCQSTPANEVHSRLAIRGVPVNQVEDAAIWIHPTDPAQSLLIVANTTRGLVLHDPDGVIIKHYHEDHAQRSGVDVMYGEAGTAVADDLVLAVCAEEKGGVQIYKIDPVKRRIKTALTEERLPVLAGHIPLGVFSYRSPKTHKAYFFVTCAEGVCEQYEITAKDKDTFTATKVRELTFPSKVKAGVADDETGIAYFSAEKTGVFAVTAEPDPAAKPALVIPVNDGHNTLDLTGLEMYRARNGAGYLILVSQNKKGEASVLHFYSRKSPHTWAGTVVPTTDGLGSIFGGSGIAVTNRSMGEDFPRGMVAVKNRVNPNWSEDYKLYAWPDLAKSAGLIIDPEWSPRTGK